MKKQFSGKKPVMFYQRGKKYHNESLCDGARIRIFYPDGTAKWGHLANGWSASYWFKTLPCWLFKEIRTISGHEKVIRLKPKNMEEAIVLAQKYDKASGFPKMEFLGEL